MTCVNKVAISRTPRPYPGRFAVHPR